MVQGNQRLTHTLVDLKIADKMKPAMIINCDVAFFRDTILHIEDKLSLFKLFHKTLKPGGSLFITDYCRGDVPALSAEFTKYEAQRGYVLKTVKQYGDLLKKAGFGRVEASSFASK